METPAQSSIDARAQSDLLKSARRAAEHAYAPYSGFPVGAAAMAADGSIHTGCNVENASYGLTVCAERAAVSAAVGAGQREIVAVAVSAPKASLTTPCGACRQFLNEFRPASIDMVVVLDDRDSGAALLLGELLPHSFGARTLDSASQAAHPGTEPTRGVHGR